MARITLTDELLAAFFDGTATAGEAHSVLQALRSDPLLREVSEIALRLDEPSAQESTQSPSSTSFLPMMQLAAASADFYAEGDTQVRRNLCSLLCEAYVLQRRSIDFDPEALYASALSAGWLKSGGTPLHAIGQLLTSHGLLVTRFYDATLQDLSAALSADNDLIVAVDSEKLHPGRPDPDDAPNHAVVVLSLNTEADFVSLFDPEVTIADTTAADSGRTTPAAYDQAIVQIPLPLFERAWNESRRYAVRVLRSVAEYTPHPVDLHDVTLSPELQELREAIAENAHDIWAAERLKEGWTFGRQRDDHLLRHPDLVPYSALPDSEKEYDRIMALNTIKLVQKLGFEIVRKQP